MLLSSRVGQPNALGVFLGTPAAGQHCIPHMEFKQRRSSKVCAWRAAASSPASTSTDNEGVARQAYIQESLNYTGAELAARLDSMQARLRAQRPPAALVPASAVNQPAASASASSSSSSSSYPATANYYASAATAPGVAAAASSTTAVVTDRPSSSTTSASPSESDSSNGGITHSSGTLQGLSASEKLLALQQVQQASRQALQAASSPSSPYYVNAPKTIDIRMYDQLVNAHNKLSKRLGESNAHIEAQQQQVDRCNEDLMAAYELLKQIAMEFGTTSRLATSTAAAVQFGVDPQDAIDKIAKLQDRLSTLEQAVLEQRQEFGLRVVRKVPVEWIGVACEVRIMGDFDGWTRGHDLSAEDVTSDSVFSRFETTLMLRPGAYRVKFLVDDEWRHAGDWPTEVDSHGNVVNVLTVA